jgi:hypothetical protein
MNLGQGRGGEGRGGGVHAREGRPPGSQPSRIHAAVEPVIHRCAAPAVFVLVSWALGAMGLCTSLPALAPRTC